MRMRTIIPDRGKKKRAAGRGIRFFALASVLAVTAGCAGGAEASKHVSVYQAADQNPELSAAMNRFALEFYQGLERHPGEESAGPNRMVSPAGLAIALSMLKGGAEGATAEELDRVLHLNGMSEEALDRAQTVARDLLRGADPSVRMEIANALWSQEGIRLNADYVQRMTNGYEAQVRALDFESSESVKIINRWSSDNTSGKIKQMLQTPPGADTMLLLMNAMYFKGEWSEPFEPALTEDLAFKAEDGRTLRVPTMCQGGLYEYGDGEGFQAVRLPYGESENFGMILALPDADRSLTDFLENDLPEFDTWSAELNPQPGTIELPRFKLEDELDLNEVLIGLGMPAAFDSDRAELGGLLAAGDGASAKPYVSSVKQKTWIDVNEEGTEAAAVTVIAAAGAAPEPAPEPFELKLNRPFFFAITDRTTGLIVFMGEVGNPEKSE